MREEKFKRLKLECKVLMEKLENLERQLEKIGVDMEGEKEMRRLARLIYAGQMLEKVGLLYTNNEQSLCEILAANKNKLQKPSD